MENYQLFNATCGWDRRPKLSEKAMSSRVRGRNIKVSVNGNPAGEKRWNTLIAAVDDLVRSGQRFGCLLDERYPVALGDSLASLHHEKDATAMLARVALTQQTWHRRAPLRNLARGRRRSS
jgi:hypothetical protein